MKWGCEIMGFFKRDEIQEKQAEVKIVNEIKTEEKVSEKNISKKRNLALFDGDTIEYVINNFPTISTEIQEGLSNLANILENTIDYIEDKSSEIIKKKRDFKLSKAHRDTSIAIYDVVKNIDEYIKWMQDEHGKNIQKQEYENNKSKNQIQEKHLEDEKESINKIVNEEGIEIYKDFSLKEPKAFKLDNILVAVENWDDLLVKTAEVLTKQYKKNKNSNMVVKEIKPIEKKSIQNSFRDTVIEMLTEYKINLDEFKIIVK